MRAYEQKKDGIGQRGIIWMIVEGDKAQVQAVCAALDKEYKNDTCPMDEPGEYSEGYFIDRNEKADFMAAYKKAKAALKATK